MCSKAPSEMRYKDRGPPVRRRHHPNDRRDRTDRRDARRRTRSRSRDRERDRDKERIPKRERFVPPMSDLDSTLGHSTENERKSASDRDIGHEAGLVHHIVRPIGTDITLIADLVQIHAQSRAKVTNTNTTPEASEENRELRTTLMSWTMRVTAETAETRERTETMVTATAASEWTRRTVWPPMSVQMATNRIRVTSHSTAKATAVRHDVRPY